MMSERMKEIFLFIAIGCAGVVGMQFAMLLAVYVIEGPSKELGEQTLAMIAMFFWAMLWGAISFKIMKKKAKSDMKMEQKEKIISGQLYTVTTLMVLAAMVMIIFIIRRITEGIIFSGLFVFAFFCWDIGCALADNLLHKNEK